MYQARHASKGLAQARGEFATSLHVPKNTHEPLEAPPKDQAQVVYFKSDVGMLSAYLTHDPKDGKRHPAIIWITGGDSSSLGASMFQAADRSNNQTASAFREAGIVTMFPTLRGGHKNPHPREMFYGEVDDILAAHRFLAKQPFVDPDRIYLGGHSTGGTLVLLAAAMTDKFQAVFSFGPVEDVRGYGEDFFPLPEASEDEWVLRAPGAWLHSIRSPTYVMEGGQGNAEAVEVMKRSSHNKAVRFFVVQPANHFSILAPVTEVIAKNIVSGVKPGALVPDAASLSKLSFTR